MKNKYIALLLTLFLGWCGVHQLYLGNTYRGTLMAMFFWTGFPFLMSVVDFFAFLFMSKSNFDRRYNI